MRKAVITIANRLSTLRNFDRILVLQGGELVEDGAPDALLRGQGVYHDLVSRELSRLAEQPSAPTMLRRYPLREDFPAASKPKEPVGRRWFRRPNILVA